MTRQTSIDAYKTIKNNGLLSERRWQVYDVLYSYGPMTAGELSEQLPKKLSRTIGSNVHARLAELKESGVVREVKTTICSVSGMKVIQWDVTSKLPKKIIKEDKIKCPNCNGKGFTRQGRLF